MIDKSEIPEHAMRNATGDLIGAAKEIASVLRYGQDNYRESAARIEQLDPQGFPVTVVIMSPTAIRMLRALATIEEGLAAHDAFIRDLPQPTPTYGPKRHQGE
jgi:hypothetical protein